MPLHLPALTIEPLTAEAFRPFGDVIEASDSRPHFTINDGFAERYHDLAPLDVASQGGRAVLSIFRAMPRNFPMQLVLLERHPLGSQAFMPLSPLPFLVVVAAIAPVPDLSLIRCFRSTPGQGVNYTRGTWHHPLIALQSPCDFLVIDRGGPLESGNCDQHRLSGAPIWITG